jgi:hypothetical protein
MRGTVGTYENAIRDDAIILLMRHAWSRIGVLCTYEQQALSRCVDDWLTKSCRSCTVFPTPLLTVGYHVTLRIHLDQSLSWSGLASASAYPSSMFD